MAGPYDIPQQPFASALQDQPGTVPQLPAFGPPPPPQFSQAIADPVPPVQDFPMPDQMSTQPVQPQFPERAPEAEIQAQVAELAREREQRAQRIVDRGFESGAAADAEDDDDTVGYQPQGPAANVGAPEAEQATTRQQAGGLTEGQAALQQLAIDALSAPGHRGDGGRRTKALKRGRAAQSQEALRQAVAQVEPLETQAGIDQLLVEDAEMQRLDREAEQQTELADLRASQVESVNIKRDEAAAAKAGEQAELEEYRAGLAAETEAFAQEQVRDRRTPGQKMVGTLAIALGGIGAAFANGLGGMNGAAHNDAMAVVNAQIERDIDNQVKALSRRQTALAARGRQYDRLGALYSDADARRIAAISAVKADYIDEAMALKQKHAGTNKGEAAGELALALQAERSAHDEEAIRLQVAAKAQQVGADAEAVYQDELARAKNAERGSGNPYRKQAIKEGIGILAEGAKPVSAEAELQREKYDNDRALPPGVVGVKRPDGGVGPATPSDATKGKDAVSDWAAMDNIIGQVVALAEKGTTFNQNDITEFQRLTGEFTAMNSVQKGQGAMTDDEFKRNVNEMLMDPTDINLRRNPLKAWKRVRRSQKTSTNAKIKPYGMALEGVAQDSGSGGASAAAVEATL